MVIATTGRQVVDIADLLSRDIPKPKALVDKILFEDSALIVAGRSKRGKSFLSIAFALSLATGKSFLGRYSVPEERRTLIIAEEDGLPRIARRIQDVARGMDLDPKTIRPSMVGVLARQGIQLDDEESFRLLKGEIRAFGPDVIVFDTLSRVHNRNEDKASDMVCVYQALDEIRREFKCSVILVHHNNKAGGIGRSAIDKMRGSSSIAAYADAFLSFGKELDPGRTKIESEGKDGDPFSFILKYENSGAGIILTAEDAPDSVTKADDDDARTLDALKLVRKELMGARKDVPGEGVKPKLLMGILGVSLNTVKARLERLAAEGRIIRVPTANGHHKYRPVE